MGILELVARSRVDAILAEQNRNRIISQFGLEALAEVTLAELQRRFGHEVDAAGFAKRAQ